MRCERSEGSGGWGEGGVGEGGSGSGEGGSGDPASGLRAARARDNMIVTIRVSSALAARNPGHTDGSTSVAGTEPRRPCSQPCNPRAPGQVMQASAARGRGYRGTGRCDVGVCVGGCVCCGHRRRRGHRIDAMRSHALPIRVQYQMQNTKASRTSGD